MRFALVFLCLSAYAEDLYLASANAGAADATSCANARIYTWFNTAANWGGGAGEIDPGDTVHLCGTITGGNGSTLLTAQTSGTSGNPITIKWEAGAKITAPYFSADGAIILGAYNYIVLDGGTDGVIENTANGTALTYQAASVAVKCIQCANVEIKNLTFDNIYVRTMDSSGANGEGSTAIFLRFVQGNNVLVHHNTIRQVDSAIVIYPWAGTTGNGWAVHHNTISGIHWGVVSINSHTTDATEGFAIYDNDISNSCEWSEPANYFHTDFIFLANSSDGLGNHNNALVYNNYLHGYVCHATAAIYFGSGVTNAKVFNNVVTELQAGSSMDGYGNGAIQDVNGSDPIDDYGNSFYHNTVDLGGWGGSCFGLDASGTTLKNNICVNADTAIYMRAGSGVRFAGAFTASNNNLFYNLTSGGQSQFCYNNSGTQVCVDSLASWRTTSGQDADSLTGNPLLTGTYALGSGSPAIGTGGNLSALGITALNSDKNGVARGSTWDIGAFEYAAPPPPTTLRNGTFTGQIK